MFCLQIHARAECTMNEKFCILHETAGPECSTEKFEKTPTVKVDGSTQYLDDYQPRAQIRKKFEVGTHQMMQNILQNCSKTSAIKEAC